MFFLIFVSQNPLDDVQFIEIAYDTWRRREIV